MRNKVVYRHLKPNGEVFYIGIGEKSRAYSKHGRSKYWNKIVRKYNYEVQVLKENLTWEEAVELEITLISYYGRRDLGTGTLCNLTDGGEGLRNHKFSEEHCSKISERNSGVNNPSYGRCGEKHPLYGKPAYNRKQVIDVITGDIFNSLKEASIKSGVSKQTLSRYLRGDLPNKTNLKYI